MNRAIARPLDISRSSPYFLALLVTALVAFWPSYLSQLVASSAYIHLHALAATLWLLLPIAQPLTGRAVFPVMLVVFAASQAPALFGLTASPGWQSFARWFADLPLT